MAKEIFGKCALCGKYAKLTFEHIPPKKALNSQPSRIITGDKLLGDDRLPWDTEGLKYINQQQGVGKYSLCKDCNNNTGTWYGNAYSIISYIVHSIIYKKEKGNVLKLSKFSPLKFIKQVISMFCSINNNLDDLMQPLREFVLDKNKIGIDKSKYKLCMYFLKNNYTKLCPYTVKMTSNKQGKLESIAMSEIASYPLGFVLYFNPTDTWDYAGVDITGCADFKYDDLTNAEIPFQLVEINDVFPEFFRTKEEIIKIREENLSKTKKKDL